MTANGTEGTPAKSILDVFRRFFLIVSGGVLLTYIGIIQAFRFDVRDEVNLDFNLCLGGEGDLVKAYKKIEEHQDDWAFYNINVSTLCDDPPGTPINYLDIRHNDTKQTFPKSIIKNDPENPIYYQLSDGTYFNPPRRYPDNLGDDGIDESTSKVIKYNFGQEYTLRYAESYGIFVTKSPSIDVEIVRASKDEGFSYYRENLRIEGMQDFFGGPFFVIDYGDSERGIDLRFKPVPDSPELFKARKCNTYFSNYWVKRVICPLVIG